ncbi:hypothetical protein D6745_04070 [Candidatus Woesearchaeota archaeon]|nr:MAG: hypothetical protein D6745_04070 [Candidatus Woesearchaeota archaeon]
MGRKAQITAFIIIGIILLISLFIVVYVRNESQYFKPEQIIPAELQPMIGYVESCAEEKAFEAVTRLGMQSGFIYFPQRIEQNPLSYLSIAPNGLMKMPYWFYEGVNQTPSIERMQRDISIFVEETMPSCLENLTAFKGQYYVVELGNISAQTTIANENVVVNVHYPLEFRNKQGLKSIVVEDFHGVVNVRLKKMYELATKIMEAENSYAFFEKRTMDFVGLDEDRIPLMGYDIDCGGKEWNMLDVKKELQRLMHYNLPYVKVAGTKYTPIPDEIAGQDTDYMKNHFYLNFTDSQYDFRVAFQHQMDWPFDLYARPSNGLLLKSNTLPGQDLLKWVCVSLWHFTYDIEYPVRVTITDSKTDEHEAYSFNFAFKVSINHNRPDRQNLGRSVFEAADTVTNEEYCNDVRNGLIIYTVNERTGEYVDDVNISFTCGPYTCEMGQSDWHGGAYALAKKFPYCIRGIVRGKADGYLEKEMFINSNMDNTYDLMLTPIKRIKDIEIIKHDINDVSRTEELSENETALIQIVAADNSYDTFSILPNSSDFPLTLLADDDFTYNLTIYVFENETLTGGLSRQWNVPWPDLENSDKITFHVVGFEGSEEEQFLFFSGLPSYSLNVSAPELT